MQVSYAESKSTSSDDGSNNEAFVVAYLIQHMHTALNEELDKRLTAAYHEAMLSNPELVASESKFVHFLRTDDYHVHKAAKRLANYWKYRKELFGERWLLPMRITGTGTLTMDDIEVIRCGYLGGIPGSNTTVQDISRRPNKHDKENFFFPRVQMYFGTVYAEQISRREGINFVFSIHSADCTAVFAHPEETQRLLNSMPCRKNSVIVAATFTEGRRELFEYLAVKQKLITQQNQGLNVHYIVGDSYKTTCNQLQQLGCLKGSLPHSLGGNYDYDKDLHDWIRMRVSIEDCMSSAPPIRNRLSTQPPSDNVGTIQRINHNSRGNQQAAGFHTDTPSLVGTGGPRNDAVLTDTNNSVDSRDAKTPTAPTTRMWASVATNSTEDLSQEGSRGKNKKRKSRNVPNEVLQALKIQEEALIGENKSLRRQSRTLESFLAQARLLAATAEHEAKSNESLLTLLK